MQGFMEPPGQRLFFWLGQAARQMREEVEVRPEVIAVTLGRGKEMIDRFERGRTRPQDLEPVLAAYAKHIGLDDPREIVVRAVRMWYDHGSPPTLNSDDPA